MKTLIAAVLGMAALSASASATISDVIVRQQWPWNGKVNIDYVLTDPEDGEHDITVVMSNGTQVVTNEYGSLSGDLFGVKPGARRIVWDPMHNNPTYTEKVLASFSVTLSTPDDNARQYMILDLSGGYDPEAPIPVSFAAKPPASGWNTDEYKTTKMVLRRIPAGSFMMGSPEDEPGRVERNEALHRVTFTNDFYVALFKCTQKQYSTIYGTIPCQILDGSATVERYAYNSVDGYSSPSNDTRMVNFTTYAGLRGNTATNETVWPHCAEGSFFGVLNSRAKSQLPVELNGWEFDCLSSSQWEYACRAGTSSAFYNGADITDAASDPNASLLGYRAYYGGIKKGGSFLSNNFGLYDMVGTFYEFAADLMPGGASTWWSGDQIEPLRRSPDKWAYFVMCSGAWNGAASTFRSASRQHILKIDSPTCTQGVRVALVYRGN